MFPPINSFNNEVGGTSFRASSGAGSIKSEKISGQKCEQESVSGSVNSELSFADFTVKTTSGSVYTGAHNEIRECRLSSVSGECTLKLYDEKNLTANVSSVSGNVNLTVGAAGVNSKGNHIFGTGKAKVSTASGAIWLRWFPPNSSNGPSQGFAHLSHR